MRISDIGRERVSKGVSKGPTRPIELLVGAKNLSNKLFELILKPLARLRLKIYTEFLKNATLERFATMKLKKI